jgi:hypothetical protein
MGCYLLKTGANVYFSMEQPLKTYVVQNPVSGLSDAPIIREKISQTMDMRFMKQPVRKTCMGS